MLSLKKISVVQFKNYEQRQWSFDRRITAVCGPNGSGKTNLLDAIYYLCFTKSYFSRQDAQIVQQGKSGLRVDGIFLKDEKEHELVCIIRENNRKEFWADGEEYKKFSEHIGKFPCVMIAPDDVELITGNSDERRKFIDTILSQFNADYLHWLIDYNKILQQRNSLLKAAAENNRLDESLLDTLDEQLAEKGQLIFTARKQFTEELIPAAIQSYQSIAQKDDGININYDSQLLKNNLLELLQINRQRDLYLQRTGFGIHKDDIEILMREQSFKNIASQGQRKSLLFALKLAEFEILKKQKGFTPVLLLDDVFEKLDAERMHNLLHKVCMEENGQVFITDTHSERMERQLKAIGAEYGLIEL
ncbi:DNA replication and repair protein RecF [mine drainage metagenome]|uniref:DNA replication and repair protein RecF n=1 Tax=mine drainage metagenome TaxID=410659 RepID=A0A1J5RVL0_9ZZZZ